ncbi:MAG TPA: MraY family glycosyltransferase [Blastocatellia bacterium]|nr:MraY family glycosyltransferase [Blastocatellia bacterium]
MRTYLTLFTLSFFTAMLVTPVVRRKASEWGAVAQPDTGRHIHSRPTPRLGGVAIYIAFIVTLLCVPFLGNMVSDSFRDNLLKFVALFAPATFIFLFGVFDDFRGASAPLKFTFQIIAAVMVYAAGFRIENLSTPFGDHLSLPAFMSFPATIMWIVVITNAFNLIDGIDGLAAGASVFALISILIFSVAQGNPEISLIAVVLVGSVMGFLRYNFSPATIFLGDSGSMFLGFMAAVLSLAGSQKGSTIVAIAIPLVSFGLPVTEAGLSLARRFVSGKSLFTGDRGHIHHKLLDRGLTQRQAVILLYAVCALFSLFGLMLLNPRRNLAALIFFVLGVGIVFGVQRLGYAEFSELGNQIRQGVTRRRRALAVNAHLRRTSGILAGVNNSGELFDALNSMLEINEFHCLRLEIDENEQVLESGLARYCRAANGRLTWSWTRSGIEIDLALSSNQYWTLRLPLVAAGGETIGSIAFYRDLSNETPAIDIGHLCGTFQRELSAALVRVKRERMKGFTAGAG